MSVVYWNYDGPANGGKYTAGIDWYALSAYSASTTYAKDALVKSAGSTTSANAQVWKSLQAGNVGNALVEGAWWTLVADGSATKPFKTLDDASRSMAANDEARALQSGDLVSLTGTYTFTESSATVTVSGGGLIAELSAGDFIGSDDYGWWEVSSVSNDGTYITGVTLASHYHTRSLTGTWVTSVCKKYVGITLTVTQTVQTTGSSMTPLYITGGYDQSGNRVGYTRFVMSGTNSITTFTLPAIGNSVHGKNSTYSYFCAVNAGIMFKFQIYNAMYWGVRNCNCAKSYVFIQNAGNGSFAYDCNIVDMNGASGGTLISGSGPIYINNCFITKRNSNYIFDCSVAAIINSTLKLNSDSGQMFYNLTNPDYRLINCIVSETSVDNYTSSSSTSGYELIRSNSFIRSATFRFLNTPSCKYGSRNRYGYNIADATIYRTASPSNKIVLSTIALSTDPYASKILELNVEANKTYIISVYVKKSSTNAAFEVQLCVPGGQRTGIDSDVTALATDDATNWQKLSVSITPTEAGVICAYIFAWGGAYYVNVDDVEVSS